MELLLLWPLLPFAGIWGPPVVSWIGIILGVAGWLSTGMMVRGSLGVWMSSGVSLGVVIAFVLKNILSQRRLFSQSERELADTVRQVHAMEREYDEKKKLLEDREKEEARAFQIYSLARSLTESFSWDSLASRFTHVLQKVTGSTDFLLYLSSDNREQMELSLRSGAWREDQTPLSQGAQVYQGLAPRWLNIEGDSLLYVPLVVKGECLGVIWIRCKEPVTHSQTDLQKILEQLIIGVQKARLFAKMESLSRLDGLTGVMRRQVFLDRADEEWNRARAFQTTFCLMMVDVDHFKKVNDTYGHPVGDTVLTKMGQLLREGIYETDTVGRYGGEEFVVLFSRAQPDGVRRKAEALRERVASETFSTGWEKLRVTISIGLAHYPRDGFTVKEVLAAADRALYAAKHGGRNRVVDYMEIRQ
ncbi:MAG TPA: sensor domain-containing diguanylate cyclase [Elusimicrobiota bacterium]|nr:sensor domain-containing diguanylate cyclase [Elusimicrobiota bacterium]